MDMQKNKLEINTISPEIMYFVWRSSKTGLLDFSDDNFSKLGIEKIKEIKDVLIEGGIANENDNKLMADIDFADHIIFCYLQYWIYDRAEIPKRNIIKAEIQISELIQEILEITKDHSSMKLYLEIPIEDDRDKLACIMFLEREGYLKVREDELMLDVSGKSIKGFSLRLEVMDKFFRDFKLSDGEVVLDIEMLRSLNRNMFHGAKSKIFFDGHNALLCGGLKHMMKGGSIPLLVIKKALGGDYEILIPELSNERGENINRDDLRKSIRSFSESIKDKFKLHDENLFNFHDDRIILNKDIFA